MNYNYIVYDVFEEGIYGIVRNMFAPKTELIIIQNIVFIQKLNKSFKKTLFKNV